MGRDFSLAASLSIIYIPTKKEAALALSAALSYRVILPLSCFISVEKVLKFTADLKDENKERWREGEEIFIGCKFPGSTWYT